MVTVHVERVKRRYVASGCSFACIFSLLTLIGTIIVPFYIAYASHNFWLKENTYREQPFVSFAHKTLIVVQGSKSDGSALDLAWSTDANMRSVYEQYLRAPVVRSSPVDTNKDGVPDAWTLSVQMPTQADEAVHSVQLLTWYRYTLNGRASLNMEAMTYVTHSSPLAGAELLVDGTAKLHQTEPLSVRARNQQPDFFEVEPSAPVSMYGRTVPNLISSYAQRNVSMRMEDQFHVWTSRSVVDASSEFRDTFCVNMTLRVPSDEILYTPEIGEVIKVAWVQYFSIAAILFILFDVLRTFVYKNGVLESVSSTDASTFAARKMHVF